MRKAKKLSITLMASVMALGVVAYNIALRYHYPKGFTICIIILCFCQLFAYV